MRSNGNRPGRIFWITGLSGCGKTTVARLLVDRLRSDGTAALLLDGDALRAIFDEQDHDLDSRRRLAMRYSRLCAEISAQGFDVVCATISMFHDIRAWNRANLLRYCEIYLRVPMAELERRDSKGIYRGASSSENAHVVGRDLPAEEPRTPDLTIDNCDACSPDAACEIIWARYGKIARQ